MAELPPEPPEPPRLPQEARAWFQASGGGNGIGLTALRVYNEIHDLHQLLFIYVLPKFWRDELEAGASGRVRILDPEQMRQPRATVVVVFEQDCLGLPEAWAEGVRQAAAPTERDYSDQLQPRWPHAGAHPGDPEQDASANQKLWAEVADPRSEATGESGIGEPEGGHRLIDGFWQLVRDLVRPLLADPDTGARVALHEPRARKLYLEIFLELLAEQVARRRPQFTEAREPLTAVRGRILARPLVERAMRRSLPLWCEFDSLDANTQVWQALRLAAAWCSRELEGRSSAVALAMEIDARLNDVSIEPVHEILGLESLLTPTLHDAPLRRLYRMALGILRNEVQLAQPAGPVDDGLVFTFKIATSGLWEELVIDAITATGELHAQRPADGKALFGDGRLKYVDITVHPGKGLSPGARSDTPPVLVLDAKYKRAPRTLVDADMADQYQLYAYANLWAVPAFLVYPASRPEGIAGFYARRALHNRGGHAGIFTLPFPRPGQRRIPLDDAISVETLFQAPGRRPSAQGSEGPPPFGAAPSM